MADNDVQLKVEVDETKLKEAQKSMDELVSKQKELPKGLVEWNKIMVAQKSVVKELEHNMNNIKDRLREAYQESQRASTESNNALQTEINLLEKRLSLRQKDYIAAQRSSVHFDQVAKDSAGAHSVSPFRPLQEIGGVKGGLGSLESSIAGSGIATQLLPKLLPMLTNPLTLFFGAVGGALLGAKKLIDSGWEKGEGARSYNIGSQDLSYRYKLSQDLAQYTTANKPGAAGLMANSEMMQDFYPALGKETGSVYLDKANRMIPYLAQYKHQQGISATETAQTLQMGMEGGFVNPKGSAHDVTQETGAALSTITSAVAAGAGMGFDRSTRMEQLHKVIQMGNKDLGATYKDTGKNIVSQLRTLENLNIRGLTGEKAIAAVGSSREALKDMATPLYASLVQSGAIPDMSKETIARFQQLGETPEQAKAHYEGLLPEQRYEAQKTTLFQGGKDLDAVKGILDKYKGSAYGVGQAQMLLKSGGMSQEQADVMTAVANNKNLSKAKQLAAWEAAKAPGEEGVAKNKLAGDIETTVMHKKDMELNKSSLDLRASMEAEKKMLEKEIIAQETMTKVMDKWGTSFEYWLKTGKQTGPMKGDIVMDGIKGYGKDTLNEAKQNTIDIGKALGTTEDKAIKDIVNTGKEAKKEVIQGSKYVEKEVKEKAVVIGETAGKWGKGIAKWAGLISSESQAAGVPANLTAAVMQQESGGKSTAISHAGAEGLMQLMPKTAKGLGVHDSFNPKQNIDGGVKYLRDLLKHYHNDVPKAVAAYNMGEGNLDKFIKKYGTLEKAETGFITTKKGGHFNFPNETKDYVNKVMSNVSRYEKDKQTHVEKTVRQTDKAQPNTYSRLSGNGVNNIDTVNVNVPNIVITPRGKEQLNHVFTHEMILSPPSTGRN